MRVIAGTARSLPLKTPEGLDTRPTTDRIKETLFNMLQPYVPGSIFIDVFSGSGGIGIEALSRGAKKAYFIERAPGAGSCIQHNLAFTKLEDRGILIKQGALAGLAGIREEAADIIFLDPPYGQEYEKRTLELLENMPYVTGDTLIIVEAELRTDFDYLTEIGFAVQREKRYKTNKHVFIQRRT